MGAGASIGGGVGARDSAISTSSAHEVTFSSACASGVSSEAWRKDGVGSAEPSMREMTESAAVGRAEEVVVSAAGAAGVGTSTTGAAGAEVRPAMSSWMRATTAER